MPPFRNLARGVARAFTGQQQPKGRQGGSVGPSQNIISRMMGGMGTEGINTSRMIPGGGGDIPTISSPMWKMYGGGQQQQQPYQFQGSGLGDYSNMQGGGQQPYGMMGQNPMGGMMGGNQGFGQFRLPQGNQGFGAGIGMGQGAPFDRGILGPRQRGLFPSGFAGPQRPIMNMYGGF